MKLIYNAKFSCARTKTMAIVKNILYPYALAELKNELDGTEHLCFLSDASNHKAFKLYPTLVQYFNIEKGIQCKILDLSEIPGETSDIIANHLKEILIKNNLTKKVIGMSADNSNTNFGGLKRRGLNNIYTKMKSHLNSNIFGIGCNAHIISNAISTATEELSVSPEIIIPQIYLYFRNYTVRTETLKEFCDMNETEFRNLLGYSKTRWLALTPSIERILYLLEPLRSYFLSQEKIPKILQQFFERVEKSKIYFTFIHNQASIFSDYILKIEKTNISVMEVYKIILEFKQIMKRRLDTSYIPLILRSLISDLEESSPGFRVNFMKEINAFYNCCNKYLEEWTTPLEEFKIFGWTLLENSIINWEDVVATVDFLTAKGIEINDGKLLHEVDCANKYCNDTKISKWREEGLSSDMKWVEIFKHFNNNLIPHNNLLSVIQFAFALPGTNAAVERVFSIITDIWSSEKTQISIQCLTAQVYLKINLKEKCADFYNCMKNNNEILKRVHGVEKYIDV